VDRSNLALHWGGVLFAQRPWLWLPYQAILRAELALRRIGLC